MRKREPARCLGPYQEGDTWRIIEIDAKGRRKSHTSDSKQAALRLVAKLRKRLESLTVEATIEAWVEARQACGKATDASLREESARVRIMLANYLNKQLDEVTPRMAATVYDRLATEPSSKTGRPLAAQSHRHYLALVTSLWKWAVKRGYVASSPWVDVEPRGRVSTHKPQLRRQEARRFAQVAEQEAAAGSGVALAALCCLSLGTRASEALRLTVRDLDLEAGEVFVNGTKSASARRRLHLPASLASLLARAAEGKQLTDRLCGAACRQTLHTAVVRLCALAQVPRVCIHGLRGTHASLAVSGGASVEAVARALGHTSTAMTLGHYITDEAATGARLAAVEAALNHA